MFDTDLDLKLMRSTFSNEFYKIYKDGFDNYLNGNWEGAKKNFEKILLMKSNDKVTENLISFMTSGPVIGMELVGESAVKKWRDLLGPTNT